MSGRPSQWPWQRVRTTPHEDGVWGREMNYTAMIRDPPTLQPELFSFHDEEPAGSRADRMPALSGPQERVQRRTVQQIVDVAPLPTLDDLVPQMVEQLPIVLRFFLTRWPVDSEQVRNCEARQAIEMPKIFTEDVPQRAGFA